MTEPLFTPDALRQEVIRPALTAVDLWSPVAEDLELGIAIQESRLTFTRQIGGGPALGLWQMEPFTAEDIWTTFLAYRPSLERAVVALLDFSHGSKVAQLETNHRYACVMARLKCYRSPEPLPELGDIPGYAHFWKTVYNSAEGKGTEAEFIANWHRAMAA